MSDRQDSNNQSEPEKVKNKGQRRASKYLGIIASSFVLPLLQLWNSDRERAAEKQQQRADEHLIAAATKKMARYTGLLFFSTLISVVSAAFTAWILWNQLGEMRAEQRPWVRVSVTPTHLVLTKWQGRQWINLGYDIAVKDFGHLPAGNVTPSAILAPHITNAREPELDVTQRKMCDQA
jgi:hypothetical protein